MHREYHPADMHHLRAHAFGGDGHGHDHDHHDHHQHNHHHHDHSDHHHHDDHTSLYVLTAVMGILIGGDVLLGALGYGSWRGPWGISLALIAAILGGARIVYQALEALLYGRIGADLALAQACLAALIIGEPFV